MKRSTNYFEMFTTNMREIRIQNPLKQYEMQNIYLYALLIDKISH